MENGEQTLITGNKAKILIEEIEEHTGKIDTEITEIKGQPAYPGIIKAKTFVALTPKDANKINKGDILVTGMTSPDYLSAMRKSSAIVTDEGGLLSHAAIVSRELNKPCIVGTKIATKILKTGNHIKLDANKGIIKKI